MIRHFSANDHDKTDATSLALYYNYYGDDILLEHNRV